MALSYRTRKRLSLLILLVGLPLYIAAAVYVVSLFDRPPVWLELVVYVALGILWALPFRAVFRGVGQSDPGERN
jgi:predicted membrane channel-forming protein YqfA (hemolysin III family)